MKQELFIRKHQSLWLQFESWLNYQEANKAKRKKITKPDIDVPHVYRQICHHLSLSQSRLYSSELIENLNRIALRGHQALYSSREPLAHKVLGFFVSGFPQLIRHEWKLVLVAALLFYGPFLVMLISTYVAPELIYTIADPHTVRDFERMYDPESNSRLGRERESDSDIFMFGYYIRNNAGIGFQTFAGGLLFGLGTLFYLLYNGILIGAVAGYLSQLGHIKTFWGFVAGHSAMELTAIVLSGVAGLKLATALISPGRKSRRCALMDNGGTAVQIACGAGVMFILAAFIEAFWSSIVAMPVGIKYSVGIFMWLVVLGYFVFLGRKNAA